MRLKMVHCNSWRVAVLLTAACCFASGLREQKCRFDRVHKMIAYNCAGMQFKVVPRNLKSSTEILDASENRIRKLTRDSFSQYTKLRFLYLFENMILKVERGTFSSLTQLETLDLSSNGLRIVPSEIFSLPLLRKLYLADNELKNEGFMSVVKPVIAPLTYLNIASTEIDMIPDFGILPELLHLNVSSNILKKLTPEQFAPLCQIKFVDLNQTNVGACECRKINNFMEKELSKPPIVFCGNAKQNCKDENETLPQAKDYLRCLTVKEERLKLRTAAASTTELSWPTIAFFSCIALWLSIMIYAHCNRRPMPQPQQTRASNASLDMVVNPNSRNTLIM